MADTIELSREVECASGPRALWAPLADTERFNRAVGLSRIQVKPLSNAGAARFLISTTLGGFRVEYEERPFEFVENEYFTFRRVMRRGPVVSVEVGFRLVPWRTGARVTVRFAVAPRAALIVPIARFTGWRTVDRFAHTVAEIDRSLARGERPKLGERATPAQPTAFDRAAQALLEAVAPGRRALAERLIEHLRTAPDVAVAHLRPFELADDLRGDGNELLAVCLQAVIAGLLELSWDLVCPSCRTASGAVPSLVMLSASGHCQLCDISFDLELDQAVEATFRPAPAVRLLDYGPYCISGPARTPHVVSQTLLPVGDVGQLRVPDEPGRLRLFVRGGATASVSVVGGAPEDAHADVSDRIAPAALSVRPGGVLHLHNLGAEESHTKLERSEWINRAATARIVGALPEFRRYFSGEVLRPGLALKVGRLALLFGDLAASTALYARAGDAAAFRLVRDSFDLCVRAIEAHGGTLVKTMGDAVMAVFVDEANAVKAAVAMQGAFPPFVARYPYAQDVDLKLGVYSGPCFAVTANGILDYFGQSVNVAARLQGQAEPGEIIMPEDLADLAQTAGWLAGARIVARYETPLKGVDHALRVARVRSVADPS